MNSYKSAKWLLRVALAVAVASGVVSCGWFGEHSRLAMQTFNEYYETEGQRLDDCNAGDDLRDGRYVWGQHG